MNFWKKDNEVSRKEFLKIMSVAGLSFSFPGMIDKRLFADPPIVGPLWVFIHAGGGWDPTSSVDPKTGPVNVFAGGDILNKANGVKIGRGDTAAFPGPTDHAFFDDYASSIKIINGIDTTTNNHDVGPVYIWSGKISQGHPTMAALIAATKGASAPLAFINNGGYGYTAGLISSSQISAGNTTLIKDLSMANCRVHNCTQTGGVTTDNQFHSDDTYARLKQVRDDRTTALQNAQYLPLVNQAIATLKNARVSEGQLQNFISQADALATRVSTNDATNNFITLYNGNTLVRQFVIAHAAYKAGLCASVNLSLGGFDSHTGNVNSQKNGINTIVNAMRFIVLEAGINNVMICVGSDFGRTPSYQGNTTPFNSGGGKDHWPITSMIFAGGLISNPGAINATTSLFKADQSLVPNRRGAGGAYTDSGHIIKPSHVNYSLRLLAGIKNSNLSIGGQTFTVDSAFPLVSAADHMRLFGETFV